MPKKILLHATRIIAAIIMLQTLYFKFTAHPDSVYIFSTVGMEPWGRIGVGILELLASILLIVPRTMGIGGVIACGLMLGAMGMHLTKLGVDVNGDGGYLFFLAVVVFICGLVVALTKKDQVLTLLRRKS